MKLITANKLKRLWNNGIVPKLLEKLDKTRVLTSKEQVQANTNAENVAGALVVKELINNLTQKLPNDVKIMTEGSGKNVKYYAQMGADATSKKLLGSASGTLTIGYKYDVRVDYSTATGATNYTPYGSTSVTGTITIVISNGTITSYNNSGGNGASGHVSIGNQWRGSTANFVITSVNWVPA